MGLLLDYYIEVTVGSAVRSGAAFAAHGELSAVLHSGGNVDPEGLPLPYDAASVAAAAGVADDLAGTVAVRAARV